MKIEETYDSCMSHFHAKNPAEQMECVFNIFMIALKIKSEFVSNSKSVCALVRVFSRLCWCFCEYQRGGFADAAVAISSKACIECLKSLWHTQLNEPNDIRIRIHISLIDWMNANDWWHGVFSFGWKKKPAKTTIMKWFEDEKRAYYRRNSKQMADFHFILISFAIR